MGFNSAFKGLKIHLQKIGECAAARVHTTHGDPQHVVNF